MPHKLHDIVLLAVLTVITSGCATLQDGRTVLKQCTPIIAPGSYVLVKNISATSDCFIIRSNYVTLDLNGFTITGNGTGAGITTHEDIIKRLSIFNGNITHFATGIELRNVSDVLIEKVRVTNNSSNGIFAGINAPGGANNIIKNCTAIDNDGTDIVTNAILVNNIADRMVAANSISIGNKTGHLEADHGLVVNNVGDQLYIGNCPALIMANNFNSLGSADPPLIFDHDCTVSHNIPSGLSP